MKIKSLIVLFIIFFITSLSTPAASFADAVSDISSQQVISTDTIYYTDGTRLEIILSENPSVMPLGTTYIKQFSKTGSLKSESGATLASFTLYATFEIDPDTGVVCTSTSYSYTTPGSGWQFDSADTYGSGNQAFGCATFLKKILLITVETRQVPLTLTCDANGNCH